MLYYFTACNRAAINHLYKTIKNKIDISVYDNLIDDNDKKGIKALNLYNGCYMWGAVPGKSNVSRWNKLNAEDKMLIYSDGKFIKYGQIVYKFHNRELAEKIWGNDKEGNTWEYIYILQDLKDVDISKESFNEFFGYNENFNPQGFNNINEKILKNIEQEYSSIDECISFLADEQIELINQQFNKLKETVGENNIEDRINEMSDEEYESYLKSLNSEGSIQVVNGLKKIRKYNKKIIDTLKERVQYRCQICGQTAVDEYGVSIVEAHHIEKFSITQNNNPENIIILCPNHHRLVHKCNAKIDYKNKEVTYSNGKIENIII